MKKPLILTLVIMSIFVLASCGKQEDRISEKNDKLQVVTSFTLLEDITKQIGGDHVDVYNLVPTGTEPHEYEPSPQDDKHAADADILLYNGMNLESGKDGWFFNLVDTVGQEQSNVFSASEGIEPLYIGSGNQKTQQNPHDFIDPGNGIKIAKNIRHILIEADPQHKDAYKQQGNDYIQRLKKMEKNYKNKLGNIPEKNRILVTSERSFQYLADHYDLKEGYLYEIDTQKNGTPKQIKDLVTFINKHQPPVLFIESNHDIRPLETVSDESGIPIYEKPIYSGEIGQQGGKSNTYIEYLKHNLDVIYNGLTENM